jgi:hypothetical protein
MRRITTFRSTTGAPVFRVEYFIIDYKFRQDVDVVFYVMGYFPVSAFYLPTFRNNLLHLVRSCEQDL